MFVTTSNLEPGIKHMYQNIIALDQTNGTDHLKSYN